MTIIPSDVVNGVLVNAIWATGRILVRSVHGLRSGRAGTELDIARWFDTYQLSGDNLVLAQDLSPETVEQIQAAVRRDEVQAVLQELLAARLTDASETDISRVRAAWDLSFAQERSLTLTAEHSGTVFNYYDEKIGELVAKLEAVEPAALAQIRDGAFSTRLIDVLNAIERHTAALSARPSERTKDSFLASYRRHVVDQHGKLNPPDFERRHRVPISDIYVPTGITEDLPLAQSARYSVMGRNVDAPSLNVFDLAGRLDRTVLLGDPGGGKTSAANVLIHRFASSESARVPFLVTLREYAAKDPPERSVVGHIEHTLATFYQCPAPAGLVDLLLLTARAVVIFDGLDELLDTSRRADVTTRVERFCAEYPQAGVLVTSRMVGYDQARLDDRQFTCFRLGGFGEHQVAEYARKWFAQDPGAGPGDAEAFLIESASVPDLRSNPLLLALMCILYRGEGSLPRDRAGIYEQCASLLLRRWDSWRRIHNELRAGHLIERALRHLAWWLFTREETQTAVTERQLIAETTKFLHGRGFESEDDARIAAREFVEFCRGRAWVFSDAGTTAIGEQLYAFTHRTFLEYFAAAHFAFDNDSPERLTRTLTPHVARGEWEVVGELAVQIKDGTSRDGAQRVYEELLGKRRRHSRDDRSSILQFLARTLRSVDPSPQVVRALTNEVLFFLLGDRNSTICGLPLAWLLASCGACQTVVDEAISARIASMMKARDSVDRLYGLRLAVSLAEPLFGRFSGGPDLSRDDGLGLFWTDRTTDNVRRYEKDIISAAADHTDMRYVALTHGLITVKQALRMRGSVAPLMQVQPMGFFGVISAPYLPLKFFLLAQGRSTDTAVISEAMESCAEVGQYLTDHPQPPWIIGQAGGLSLYNWGSRTNHDTVSSELDSVTYLGAAGIAMISAESESSPAEVLAGGPEGFGPFSDLYFYIRRRHVSYSATLPELPVPDEFKQVFQDWAERKVNFTTSD